MRDEPMFRSRQIASNSTHMRWSYMQVTITSLIHRMEAAAAALDFEEARRCRDMISLIRGGATVEEALKADVSGLERPKPGAMGLGTSQQRLVPSHDWQAPAKPDPMTTGRSSRGRKRK
jgi:hypothetical protein